MEAWFRFRADRFGQAARWTGLAVLSLLLAGLSSPATASEEGEEPSAPEWNLGSVSTDGALGRFFRRLSGVAPGAAKARLGLGLEAFFEHQESLRITSMESDFTTRDLVHGREESGILHGDPGLLNRKFDIRWEMEGAGVEVPIALPRLGGFADPTLVLRAATADVTLDFLDRVQARDSTSLGGRGDLFGAEVNVVAALNGPWFTEASYGFQRIPSFTVERSPRFAPTGFEVLGDEVRLGRDVQEIATRIGYNFPGTKITAYTGVLHRWTDLDVEDRLRYRDPQRATETRLSSRTELESDATLAVAGVDYRIGPRLNGRLETSVGEKDWKGVIKVVYFPEAQRKEPFDFAAFAASVAPRLARLEIEFRERRQGLGGIYRPVEVERLLGWTEGQLFEILHPRELAPLRDSIRFRFRRFRRDLGGTPSAEGRRPGFAQAALRGGQAPGGTPPSGTMGAILDAVENFLRQLTGIAEERRFTVRLCVDSLPRGAKFKMWPPEDPKGDYPSMETIDQREVVRGRYVYKIRQGLRIQPVMQCPTGPPAPDEPEEPCLDLLEKRDAQFLQCTLGGSLCDEPRDLRASDNCPSP